MAKLKMLRPLKRSANSELLHLSMSATARINSTALPGHAASYIIGANAAGTEACAFWCDLSIDLDHRVAARGKDRANAEDSLLRAHDPAE